MERKRLLLTGTLLAILVFFISSALLWKFTQTTIGIVDETRKEAIVRAISKMQASDGSLQGMFGAPEAIIALSCLRCLNRINASKAVDYIVSQQNKTTGGFPLESMMPLGEMYHLHQAVIALKIANASSKLSANTIAFVMQRYNETDGSFHELSHDYYGEERAWCDFPLIDYQPSFDAYKEWNIIDALLAVSTLNNLNALDRINITKTIDWVSRCRALSGGFAPFRMPQEPYRPWWTMGWPFRVDENVSALAYTYAAMETLSILDHVDSLGVQEIQSVKEYVLSCQSASGFFTFTPEKAREKLWGEQDEILLTHLAVKTLHYIGAVNQTEDAVRRAEDWLLNMQEVRNSQEGGLFLDYMSIDGAYDVTMVLNTTGDLHLLDELTPRAIAQRNLVFIISSASALSTFIIAVTVPYGVNRLQKRNKNPRLAENRNLIFPQKGSV